MMKKIYYLKTNENRDSCLNLLYKDKNMDKFIFEIANEIYYPWSYYEKPMADRDRVLVFANTLSHIPLWHIPYILSNDSNLKEPLIGSNGGYIIYPESLMMGFSKTIYFSLDEDKLISIVDKQTSSANIGVYSEELIPGIMSGNFAKSLQNGINYAVFDGKLQYGQAPTSLNEILVSDTLFKELGCKELGERLYLATSRKEVLTTDNKVISDYVMSELKIVGTVRSNKNLIYHEMNWPILFYQCQIGISAFELQCQNLSFSLNNPKNIDESLIRAQKAFQQYEIINPLSDIDDSVDTVCFYITIVLIIFSLVATSISILLLTICNYIYIIEGRKEIALARCLGVNKRESQKFLFYHSLFQCLISFAIASIEIFIVSIIANLEIASSLSTGFSFSFNPFCLVPMFVLSLFIGLTSSFVMSKRINKINPLEALKA